MADVIKTIEDLEKLYYSSAGQQFLNQNDLVAGMFTKADDPTVTSTTGVYNAVYGAQAWVQLNLEANTVGVLPKVPWKKSGWRVITARALSARGGVAENGALPDSVKPTFAEVSTKPKTAAIVFEVSEVQEYLAKNGDDAFGALSDLRAYFAVEHKDDLNQQLNTQNGTVAGDNFESIDRVAGSYAERTNAKENDQSTSYSANDLDIYGQDRDAAASWADAYVNYSTSLRSLTESLLNSLLQNTLANGANGAGQFFQTGYDTWSTINGLYETAVRYNIIGEKQIKPGVNGIQPVGEHGVGLTVSTLFGKPLIVSKDTVQETGGISRVYLLDASNPEGFEIPRLSLKIAKPTQYFEAGISQGSPFQVGKFSSKGMYRTMGELVCAFFKAQGKLRDLKA